MIELRPAQDGDCQAGLGRLSGALAEGVRFRLDRSGSGTGVAVLTVGRGGGALKAEAPFVSGRTARATLLRLAQCFSDCAMELGLGAAVMGAECRVGETDRP